MSILQDLFERLNRTGSFQMPERSGSARADIEFFVLQGLKKGLAGASIFQLTQSSCRAHPDVMIFVFQSPDQPFGFQRPFKSGNRACGSQPFDI
jgi:hypothetical protein